MNVVFHSIKDDRKKINKSLNEIATVTAQLKTPCSIMKPVLQVTKESIGTQWYRINYVQIPAFGRYYHVDTVNADNDGLITFECAVDVLFTYASNIMDTQFQVIRAQRNYNMFFNDTQLPLLSDKNIRQDKNIDFLGSIPQSTGANANNYVLTVAGGGATQ